MPRTSSTRSTRTYGNDCASYGWRARVGTCVQAKRRLGRAATSKASDSIVCSEPSVTRRLHNAEARLLTGKPCAGNPHARFERGSCTSDCILAKGLQDLPMNEKNVIAVVGSTGSQGGGLCRSILDDPSGGFACRAITRDPSKDKA